MTEFESIKRDPKSFPFGKVLEIKELGSYGFVQHQQSSGLHNVLVFVDWTVYVDGRSTGQRYPSLETAMLGEVVYRHLGQDGAATRLICRMLGIPTEGA